MAAKPAKTASGEAMTAILAVSVEAATDARAVGSGSMLMDKGKRAGSFLSASMATASVFLNTARQKLPWGQTVGRIHLVQMRTEVTGDLTTGVLRVAQRA